MYLQLRINFTSSLFQGSPVGSTHAVRRRAKQIDIYFSLGHLLQRAKVPPEDKRMNLDY